MRFFAALPAALAIALAACTAPRAPERPRPVVELVESAPVETSMNRADVPDASEVWPRMIDGATSSVAVAQFYVSEAEGPHLPSSLLTPVLGALERALARGVAVRLLADGLFAAKYPASLARLRARGAAVRILDASKLYGGVMHAKYLVVDERDAFVGSQNFDWRSLAHTCELGVRIRSREHALAVLEVFETDWALAGGASRDARTRLDTRIDPAVAIVASPKGWLPREDAFELDAIVGMLARAKREIRVMVLLYSTEMRDKSAFTTLDDALRAATKRGVRVRLLVSDWSAKPGGHERASIEALAEGGVDVRVVTIPKWSGGDIPFARVAHAKLLVVDDDAAWLGSSNWEGDYFLKTRDVGVVLRGGEHPPRIASFFEGWWSSAYAAPLTGSSGAPPAAAAPPSSSDPARR